MAQTVKNLPAMQETGVWFLGWKDPLKKGMATHSSILAWRIPWTEEPGGLQFMRSQRGGHDWATNIFTLTEVRKPFLMYIHWSHFLGGHFGTSTDLNSMISPLPLGTFTLECKDTRELYCSIIFLQQRNRNSLNARLTIYILTQLYTWIPLDLLHPEWLTETC